MEYARVCDNCQAISQYLYIPIPYLGEETLPHKEICAVCWWREYGELPPKEAAVKQFETSLLERKPAKDITSFQLQRFNRRVEAKKKAKYDRNIRAWVDEVIPNTTWHFEEFPEEIGCYGGLTMEEINTWMEPQVTIIKLKEEKNPQWTTMKLQ